MIRQILEKVFRKFLYWARYFLTFLSIICSFSAKREICYSADGNSLYSCGMNLDNIFTNVIQDALQTDDITTKSVSSVTLMGNTIDSKLNFREHINNRKKAYYKLYSSEDYENF